MNVEVKELEDLKPIAAQATAIVVRNNDEHLACVDYLKANKAAQAKIHAKMDPIVKAAHESHKASVGLLDELLKPFEEAYKKAADVDKNYQLEQERIRQAEQKRLQDIEAERARKAREAAESQARIQREKEAAAQAEAEGLRRKAAEASNAAERERLNKEAEARQKEATKAAAAAQAREEKAAAVVENVVTVASNVGKSSAGLKKTWKGSVVDMAELIKAATPGSVASTFLMVDESVMNKFAAATKGALPVPGVKFAEVSSLSVRSK